MNLWIRGQNKDILINVKSLLIDDDNYNIYTQDYIGTNLVTYTLGRYEARERALEVLDDIQRVLKNESISSNFNKDLVGHSCYVYEMPKE